MIYVMECTKIHHFGKVESEFNIRIINYYKSQQIGTSHKKTLILTLTQSSHLLNRSEV